MSGDVGLRIMFAARHLTSFGAADWILRKGDYNA